MMNKRELYELARVEARASRIKNTQKFILEQTHSSLMNNFKWVEVFECFRSNTKFEIKMLLSDKTIVTDRIFEIEESAILVKNSERFIEYLEIEYLRVFNGNEFFSELKSLNVELIEEDSSFKLLAYRLRRLQI